MEKIQVIITTPFTGKRTETGFNGQEWYEKRYEIFKNFTLKSLLAQTDKNFFYWLCFRPEELDNPITLKIKKELDESGLDYKMTFHGINFVDDKVPQRNKDLEERLDKMFSEIPHLYGNIYEVMVDSDDMLHKDYIETIKRRQFRNRGACYMKQGYIYDAERDRLAHWFNPASNQNYMIMFRNDVYYNPQKRLEYLKGFLSHEQVPTFFEAEELPAGMFCSIVHGQNISTVWGHPFMKEVIYDEEIKNNVLKEFGINL